MNKVIAVSEVVFRDDLYPRISHDPALVQRYAANLEVLPPIEVNQHNELIDGWHRWTAHKKNEATSVTVTVTETKSEAEFLMLAIKRNSAHGAQLADGDKKKMAVRLYAVGTGLDKKTIAETLSVSEKSVSRYLSDIEKQLREQRKETIQAMYLACHTQDEIAAAVGVGQKTVSNELESFSNFGQVSKITKTLAEFAEPDFTPPLYNVWTFAKKSNGVSHFGNSEQRIVDNLLYLYTEPFDIVLDPFGGGGSTIDVCKRRLRRYWVSDRKPIPERAHEIRHLDIVDGLPPLAKRWSDVTLTYLDPPYWKQAENQYSQDAEDLANMPLDEFTANLAGVVRSIAEKQSKGVIALIIQPTQWKAEGRKYTDHVMDLIQAVGTDLAHVEMRISAPYSTEQYTPQMVNWAKENKQLMVLTREIIVWRVGGAS